MGDMVSRVSVPGAGLALSFLVAMVANAQTVRVLKFSEARQFQMGRVTSHRIVHPEMGARNITLNHSASEAGDEFSQHVHDDSDDTILIFKGQGDLRQGDSRRRFVAGQSAFVPAGQVHGTITTEAGTVMISFQTPPDMALYTGARDSSRAGAAPPKGAITPGAVKFVDFAGKDGFFIHPGMGAQRIAVAHRKLRPGGGFQASVSPGGEQVVFVRQGAVRVNAGGERLQAGEKDAVFVSGPAKFEVRNDSGQEAVIIQAQAPPEPGWDK